MLMIKDFTRFYPVVSRLIKPYDRRSVERQRGRADLDTREDDFAHMSLSRGGVHTKDLARRTMRQDFKFYYLHVHVMSMSMCMHKHVHMT